MPVMHYPVTPDRRYFVVRGRLWRMSRPDLADEARQQLVSDLMSARRAVGEARRAGDNEAEKAGRKAVDAAKRGLGERGAAWWTDGSPDLNRHMVTSTVYAEWYRLEASHETRMASSDITKERPA